MFGCVEVASLVAEFKPVKDPRGLLTLPVQMIATLGPVFLWIIMLLTVTVNGPL